MTSFKARVLYNFTALDDDQLTITPGQILTIVDAEPDLGGWALAENGQRDGYVPIDYVRAIDTSGGSMAKQCGDHSLPFQDHRSLTSMPSVPSVPCPATVDAATPIHALPPKVAIPNFGDDQPALTATSSATSSSSLSTPSLRSPMSSPSDSRDPRSRGLLSLLDSASNSKDSTTSMSTPCSSAFAQPPHHQTTPFIPNYGANRGASYSVMAQRFDPMHSMKATTTTSHGHGYQYANGHGHGYGYGYGYGEQRNPGEYATSSLPALNYEPAPLYPDTVPMGHCTEYGPTAPECGCCSYSGPPSHPHGHHLPPSSSSSGGMMGATAPGAPSPFMPSIAATGTAL